MLKMESSKGSESSKSSSLSQEPPSNDSLRLQETQRGTDDGTGDGVMPEKYADVRCTQLYNEWRRCISASNQFHQYYIYGTFKDCTQERLRMFNCIRWKSFKNEAAKDELVNSFDTELQNMHTEDPPWELRSSPPADWDR